MWTPTRPATMAKAMGAADYYRRSLRLAPPHPEPLTQASCRAASLSNFLPCEARASRSMIAFISGNMNKKLAIHLNQFLNELGNTRLPLCVGMKKVQLVICNQGHQSRSYLDSRTVTAELRGPPELRQPNCDSPRTATAELRQPNCDSPGAAELRQPPNCDSRDSRIATAPEPNCESQPATAELRQRNCDSQTATAPELRQPNCDSQIATAELRQPPNFDSRTATAEL